MSTCRLRFSFVKYITISQENTTEEVTRIHTNTAYRKKERRSNVLFVYKLSPHAGLKV